MGVIVKYHTFADGIIASGLITADRLNTNFDRLYSLVNGGIDEDNIKNPCKVMVSSRSYTGANAIAGTWEFSVFPTVPAGSIPDAKLTSNVPLKNAANTFAAKQTFSAGAEFNKAQSTNFNVEQVASLPAWVAGDKGRILYCTSDNKTYVGNNAGWVQLDYVGEYTGGSMRSYTAIVEVDEWNGAKLYFKTDGVGPTVKIAIRAEEYSAKHYLELPYHTHAFTGNAHTHALTDGGHTHNVVVGAHGHGATQYALSTHTHLVSGNTGIASANHTHDVSGTVVAIGAHEHGGVTVGAESTAVGGGHDHAFSDTSTGVSADHTHGVSITTGTPSASGAIASHDYGTIASASNTTGITAGNTTPSGTNAHAGVDISGTLSSTRKRYANTCTVKIDGTSVTANVLGATGWAAIGDGTSGHAVHTAGSGEMTASAWVSYAAGLHTLEILSAVAGSGCRFMVHIETS